MPYKHHDSPLYYLSAREAAQIERDGDYGRAAKVWAKANRTSRNTENQDWSEKRSDFCLAQLVRESGGRNVVKVYGLPA